MADGKEASALSTELRDGIMIARMNRPKQRNPFTPELVGALKALVTDLGRRRDVDALIIIGADGVFSAGGDLKGMVERHNSGGISAEDMRQRIYEMHEWVQPLRNLEIPVIAAVDGVAYGGGFAIALCADFVLATPRARFCSVFCRIGLVPDCGVFYTLPRVVGLQRAKELIYTGRPVGAEEAKALGIAMEIHPPETLEQEALTLARRMQAASRATFGMSKRIVNRSLESDVESLIEMEASSQAVCVAGDYHRDAVERFVNKQPLRFNWEA